MTWLKLQAHGGRNPLPIKAIGGLSGPLTSNSRFAMADLKIMIPEALFTSKEHAHSGFIYYFVI